MGIDLSSNTSWTYFFSGVYMASFAGAGVFFLKFWTKTSERFFLNFAGACFMLSLERLPLTFFDPQSEPYSYFYLFRLTAFVMILRAVLRANGPTQDG